jgi:hypothetical protein
VPGAQVVLRTPVGRTIVAALVATDDVSPLLVVPAIQLPADRRVKAATSVPPVDPPVDELVIFG